MPERTIVAGLLILLWIAGAGAAQLGNDDHSHRRNQARESARRRQAEAAHKAKFKP
jgi:hypothetical protein